ncbi:MAG: exosortase/archaeosortase family protein, partial [Anaerolineae bacterium]|nr:exosortase/archaeosortase family protein [Anaerolineae bacterium]
MEIQGRTALEIKILVALMAPAILYWQDLILVANEALNSDIATHILAIPFLLTYIVYLIRKTVAASASQQLTSSTLNRSLPIKEITGTLMCVLAYLIKWFGSYTFQPLEIHVASLPLFVAGIVLFVFNTQTLRALLFPIAFLIFLTLPPLELAQSTGSALANFSSQAAYNLLKMFGLPVTLSTTYGSPVIFLTTPAGTDIPFAIDIACSGLYSLIGFTIFAIFTAYIARGSLQKKLSILAMGLPLIYSLNILRITSIVLIGYYSGPNLALNIFHVLGGWTLILVGTLILLTVTEKVFKIKIFGTTPETCPHSNESKDDVFCMDCGKILKTPEANLSKTDALKLTILLAITISLLFIEVPVFALTEGSAEVFIQKPTGEQTTTKILPEIEDYQARFTYRDIEFEKISGQNASLIFQYSPENQSKPIIWVGLEIGPTKACLHPWEACLIEYGGGDATQLDLRDIHLLDNPPLSARYFAFQRKGTDNTQVILYWYTKSIFKTGDAYQQKWVKLSVIAYTHNPQEYRAVEDELLPIAVAIANYWQPITTWSWVALTLAENGPTLITMTGALLLGPIAYYLYLERNKRRGAQRAYAHISDAEDRQILDSVKALKKDLATES